MAPPSVPRTPAQWLKVMREEKSSHQLAARVLSELFGYRQNALQRANDVDHLTYALEAAMMLGREQANPSQRRSEP